MLKQNIINSPATIKIDGRVLAFENLIELVWNQFGYQLGYRCTGHIERFRRDVADGLVVVRDHLGIPIPADDVINLAITVHGQRKGRAYWSRPRTYTFRSGPVPGIRCFRGGGGYWRSPRTTAERRVADAIEHDPDMRDLGIRIRGRRKNHALPSAWDDLWRDDQKCWKRQRRTQYKNT